VKKKDIHDNKTVEQYMITDSVLEKYKTWREATSSSSNVWFILSATFRPHYGPGIDSTYNRNE
jgi:hypothetical protein